MQRTSESSGSSALIGSATRATPGASVRSWVVVADHTGSLASHTSEPSSGASPQYERMVSCDAHAWPRSTSPAGISSGNELLRSSTASSLATTYPESNAVWVEHGPGLPRRHLNHCELITGPTTMSQSR